MIGKHGKHDHEFKKQKLQRMKCKHGGCKAFAIDRRGYCELHEPITYENIYKAGGVTVIHNNAF